MSDIAKLSKVLNFELGNVDLYREALTHKSFAAEHGVPYDNQRLELLGDAVAQILLTDYLFRKYPLLKEGDLTKIRSALANQASFAGLARKLDLGSFLMLGKGEKELNGGERESTISDAFESVLGAIYLDKGIEVARKHLVSLIEKTYPDPAALIQKINPKGALQEFTQCSGGNTPTYKVVSVSGPDHDPVFTVEVSLAGHVLAEASASSRRLAEAEAAKIALERLKKRSGGEEKA